MQQVVAHIERIIRPTAKRIQVRIGDVIHMVAFSDIGYFEADEKYSSVITLRDKYLIDMTLAELEEKLPADEFVRIHRKHIVNVNYIIEMHKWFDRKLKIKLKPPFTAELIASRGYAENLEKIALS
jgi:DNA-binding LytR/AlgR family response regulator